jgi:hypothetical protein
MARFDLAFILCCCRACLGGDSTNDESFYDLLGIDRHATMDEIKRAYKRKSLAMHPDKLAQKGKAVTPEDQAKFTRMKEAYECLSDKHKKETYDAIGERGMKWIEEPFSIDPQQMAHNFATSSTLDRSKIFAIFVAVAIAIFLLPILVCLQVDGKFGDASWCAILTPLWLWNAFILFYHVRVILMGPIEKPDHVSEEEWEDPLPMRMRYIGLCRFLLFFFFLLLAALNLDGFIAIKWFIVFVPMFILEAMTLVKRIGQSSVEIITIQELETIMGKPFTEFTEADKEMIAEKYTVMPNKESPSYLAAQAMKENAKMDVLRTLLRSVFLLLLLVQVDAGKGWSWWRVFTPFFLMSFCICCIQLNNFQTASAEAAQKLNAQNTPMTSGNASNEGGAASTVDYGAMEEGGNTAPNASGTTAAQPLSPAEEAEIKARLIQANSRLCTACCSQIFLLILLCLCLGKIEGAGFSSLWIISPFLFIASIVLCVLGCTIFCISPMDEEDTMFGNQSPYQYMSENAPAPTAGTTPTVVPMAAAPSSAPIIVDPEQPASNKAAQPSSSAATSVISDSSTTNAAPQAGASALSEQKDQRPTAGVVASVPTLPQIDLLDDNNTNRVAFDEDTKDHQQLNASLTDRTTASGTVVPTKSEVDDLD